MIRCMIRLKNDEIKLIKILKGIFQLLFFWFCKKKKKENQTEN